MCGLFSHLFSLGCAQVNCLFTASYSLYLRGVMDSVVQVRMALRFFPPVQA